MDGELAKRNSERKITQIHSECRCEHMDRGWEEEIHRKNLHKFTNCADVSMDGELAMGTLINGRSLAQTTFAPATNTKALPQI